MKNKTLPVWIYILKDPGASTNEKNEVELKIVGVLMFNSGASVRQKKKSESESVYHRPWFSGETVCLRFRK